MIKYLLYQSSFFYAGGQENLNISWEQACSWSPNISKQMERDDNRSIASYTKIVSKVTYLTCSPVKSCSTHSFFFFFFLITSWRHQYTYSWNMHINRNMDCRNVVSSWRKQLVVCLKNCYWSARICNKYVRTYTCMYVKHDF